MILVREFNTVYLKDLKTGLYWSLPDNEPNEYRLMWNWRDTYGEDVPEPSEILPPFEVKAFLSGWNRPEFQWIGRNLMPMFSYKLITHGCP
jgi:hypothetical protein